MTQRFLHKTVLLQESIEGLDIHPGDIYLDGTLGSGGHAEAVIKTAASGKVTIIGLDRDEDALARAAGRFGISYQPGSEPSSTDGRAAIILRRANYRDLDTVLDALHIPQVNRILLDIGLSSDQFETSKRGFSFKEREPLLMTFEKNPEPAGLSGGAGDVAGADSEILTAKQIVNEWAEETLADVIYGYGEERYARKIAKAIVEARAKEPIRTTHDLVTIIEKATPFWYHKIGSGGKSRIHPATRTFQALRIAVNDELNALKDGLKKGFERLAPGGRLAIISFHSLEDRIVKHAFKKYADEGQGKLITKRPITASEAELAENPRARSAKLRIIEKF